MEYEEPAREYGVVNLECLMKSKELHSREDKNTERDIFQRQGHTTGPFQLKSQICISRGNKAIPPVSLLTL